LPASYCPALELDDSAADWLSILLADFPMPRGNSGNSAVGSAHPSLYSYKVLSKSPFQPRRVRFSPDPRALRKELRSLYVHKADIIGEK
jgi:hypothetical protein